jgi:hypothetical protein
MHSHSAIAARFLRPCFSFCAAILLLAIGWQPAGAQQHRDGQVSHIVIFWLKEPQNTEHRQQIARACEELRQIPGVERVEVGDSLPVQREGIEQPFDMSVVFTLRDRAALDDYQRHPDHKRAVESVLKPLVQRYIVFDSVVR